MAALGLAAVMLQVQPSWAAGQDAVTPTGDRNAERRLIAQVYNSGFKLAHNTYNGISSASDGKIYYVLSSESYEVGAQVYCFDPSSGSIRHLGDLTEACGEKGQKTIVQGKSHVNFVESKGKLYFATHIGYYSIIDGMEKMGIPPAGWKPYPGGHLLAYEMATGKFEDLAIAPEREGILTMNMDTKRGRIYGLTWPTGHFFRFDLATKEMKDFGRVSEEGENGKGAAYRTICRSIAVDPEDGMAFLTIGGGAILRYRCAEDKLETVEGEDMKKDYFGLYDPTSPGHMGYNWRQIVWRPADQMFYGVHGNSGYLFRFDPRAVRVEVLVRLTSEPSKRSGMFDQFSYGYLGFKLGPDGRTLHYLTGGPIYVNGKRLAGKSSTAMGEAKGLEDLHLVTYDIPTGKYTDCGAVFYPNGQRPLYVNSIAIGKDGTVYCLARITENGRTRADLIGFPGPLKNK
jgi:outer membrane protein assembly factor BamB